MAGSGWYPKRDAYFAELTPERPTFQGDIFRGVPTVFVAHPAAREAAYAGLPSPSPQAAERPLTAKDVSDGVVVRGPRAMVSRVDGIDASDRPLPLAILDAARGTGAAGGDTQSGSG